MSSLHDRRAGAAVLGLASAIGWAWTGCIATLDEPPRPRSPSPPATSSTGQAASEHDDPTELPFVAIPQLAGRDATSAPQHPFLLSLPHDEDDDEGAPQLPESLLLGAPEAPPDQGPAIAIWVDEDGIYHLRLLAHGKRHRFTARLGSYPSTLQSVRAAGLLGHKPPALLKTARGDLSLSVETSDNKRGLEFQLPAGACAHFDLFIDGKANAKRVLLGRLAKAPPGAVFQVCP